MPLEVGYYSLLLGFYKPLKLFLYVSCFRASLHWPSSHKAILQYVTFSLNEHTSFNVLEFCCNKIMKSSNGLNETCDLEFDY